MLQFLDLLLTLLHFLIIGFNLFGWMWPRLRKAHFIGVLLTAGSWLILGIWYGLGYCPITEWQWRVKEQLGETNLPGSFVKYYADKWSGKDFSADLVNKITAISFACAAALSIYFNFLHKRIWKTRR